MSKKVFGTAVAAVFASAIAGAQTTGQDQQDPQASGRQVVTIEGCLQQQPGATAATVDDASFVIQNAQVRSGSEAVGTTGETAGTVGSQRDTQAEAGRDRTDEAVGTSGAAGAAGSAASGMASYKLEGLDDDKLTQHVGQRVQVQGYFETRGTSDVDRDRHEMDPADRDRTDADRPRGEAPTAGAPTEPTGTTGAGIEGHGRSGTTAAGAEGAGQHGQMAGAAGEMKTFRATSIQRISGECPPASR